MYLVRFGNFYYHAFIAKVSRSVATFSWSNLTQTLADKSEPFPPSNIHFRVCESRDAG